MDEYEYSVHIETRHLQGLDNSPFLNAMSRSGRGDRYRELAAEALSHDDVYTTPLGPFTISAHPRVFSPKYFPSALFFAESLPAIVGDGAFLEMGVGTGIASLYVAAAASGRGSSAPPPLGVDINPLAVELAARNFRANRQAGRFLVSDLFDALEGRGDSFDCIFWNHPWSWDAAQCEVGRDAMYVDDGYAMLGRFLAQARAYLTQGGSLVLGTSEFANLEMMEGMYADAGYQSEIVGRHDQDIGGGLTEVLYLVQLKPA